MQDGVTARAIKVALLDAVEDDVAAVYAAVMPPAWTFTRTRSYDEGDQVVAADDADVLFISWTSATAPVMAASSRLALVQKLGVGTDRVDLAHCEAHGVAVARLAGVNAVAVAEHVVLMTLAVLRQLPRSDRRIRAGEWFKEEARGFQRELRGKTVSLVGLGYVGREVARRLRPFDVDLRYYDPRRLSPAAEAELGLTYLDLDDLIASADIVSLHVPLTPSTAGLLSADRIARLRPGAFVVNCARGGLIDEVALEAALRSGHVGGAALDCFAHEPVGRSGLLELDTVVASPHVAGATLDNVAYVARRAVANVSSYLSDGSLPAEDIVYLPTTARGRMQGESSGGIA